MAAKRTSSSASRTPVTRQGPALPTHPVETGTGLVRLELDRDNSRRLTVFINDAPSSFIDLDDPCNVGFEYMEIMLAVLQELKEGPVQVVHLGAAGSTMARAIDRLRPQSRQIGVDIDGALLDYARQWFDLPRAPRLRLRTADARAALATMRDASADVIVRDVFADNVTPGHLTTVEFTLEVLRVLRPGGLYLVNCADRPPLLFARQEVATLWASRNELIAQATSPLVDGDVAVISEPALLKGRRYGNLVMALTKPVPKVGSTEDTDQSFEVIDLDSAGLGRRLRSLAVPAHLACGDEAKMFARNAPALLDPPTPQ